MSTASAQQHGPFPRRPRPSIEELIRAKGARPIESADELYVPGVFSSDEEVDEFNEAVREWRNASVA